MKVVIVGGGTSGWMTATYLRAAFSDRLDITLVESEKVTPVGVGEATFSEFRHFFGYLGIPEHEWMPSCEATYKLGVRFENWRQPEHYFYHPFEPLGLVRGFTLADWWLHLGGERFDHDCFVVAAMCDAKRAPRHLDGTLFESDLDIAHRLHHSTLSDPSTQFTYAYHFDATLLAGYLAQRGRDQGIQHIRDSVEDVGLDERGWIQHVVTAKHGELDGDLFIDCTGFRGLLMSKALDEPFVSFQEFLPNDRAVALRVPADPGSDDIRPCTTATAMDAGWIWTIPLYTRIGTGYVYASDYCSPDEAEQTLRDRVGAAAEDLEANHIQMRVGRSERSWVNNCVAIGLSSAFVEPLESTGIFFIQYAVDQLVRHFPADDWDPALQASFNRRVSRCVDGVREFLSLHYRAAGRSDTPYWKDAHERPLPDGLAERIEEWRNRIPEQDTIYPHYHGFEPYSYICMLMGLGGLPLKARPALAMLDEGLARQEFQRIRELADGVISTLPGHYEYLTHVRNE